MTVLKISGEEMNLDTCWIVTEKQKDALGIKSSPLQSHHTISFLNAARFTQPTVY